MFNTPIKYYEAEEGSGGEFTDVCKMCDNRVPVSYLNKNGNCYLCEDEDKPDQPVNTEEKWKEAVRLISYMAWKAAANAFRIYPNNKHAFANYDWEDNMKFVSPLQQQLSKADEIVNHFHKLSHELNSEKTALAEQLSEKDREIEQLKEVITIASEQVNFKQFKNEDDDNKTEK
jgi:hypothetical protein